MKPFLFSRGWFALGFALATVLCLGNRAHAQQGQGIYIEQASARLDKLVESANKTGYFLPNDAFSIAGSWVKQDKKVWVPLVTVRLTAGKEYRFLATGDNDARDVDLDIQDADGKTVAIDDDVNPAALVNFTPTRSGDFTIRVRLYESRDDLPCMCLAIMLVKKE
jgi:hypothetical protein